jgi:hypothetical protein
MMTDAAPMSGTDAKLAYQLCSPFIGKRWQHPLSPDEYAVLKDARAFLGEYIDFEEALLQVLYSYEEFESFLLTTALNEYLFPLVEYDFLQDTRIKANLRVLSFLNSVTSLRDQFPKFRCLLPQKDAKAHFQALWNTQKATSIVFRFCERFRNFAQHQTQPVASVTTGGAWDKQRVYLESHLTIFASLKDVCANRDIGAAEKAEYASSFGAYCDVGLIFRESVGCIGKIGKEMRDFLGPEFTSHLANYRSNLALTNDTDEKSRTAIAERIKGNAVVEEFQIFSEFSDRAERLHRIFLMTNNHEHFISNRPRGHQKKL